MTEERMRMEAYAKEFRMRRHGVSTEATAVCANCQHFIRHYVVRERDGIRFDPTPYGHCVLMEPEIKEETDVCEAYKQVDVPELPKHYRFNSLGPFWLHEW